MREAGLSRAAADSLRDAAFANELVRLGDVAGVAATESRAWAREAADLSRRRDADSEDHREALLQIQEKLRERKAELSLNRAWLEAVRASNSGRTTAPARAARRAVNGPHRPV